MKPLNFGQIRDEILKKIDLRFPVKLNNKKFDLIISKIAEQYPLLERSDISRIVVEFFNIIRHEMFMGKIININSYLQRMGVFYYFHGENLAIRSKISTPKKIKND